MPQPFDQFAATLTYDDLPDDVLWTLRRSFTDTVGTAAVGTTTQMADIARRGARALFGVGGAGAARIMLDGTAVSPAGAAMAGAFTVDAIDAHDTTSPAQGHAGSAVFPALLAFADASAVPVTGRDFMLWLAIAYEVSYRAGLAQHATCADYHTSGAWTSTGIAVAVARAMGLNRAQIRHAAGIGEFHGPRSQMMRCIDHPTMLRDGVGWGAPSGLSAAYLAREEFTGAPALTCEDAPEFWRDLGTVWRTVTDTAYKPYPCCRWAHPAIDAAAGLMTQHGVTHQDITRVKVRTFHKATRLAGHTPKSLDEFTYSIAFPLACMIVRGQIGLEELQPETLQDADILRISTATELIDDPHYTRISVGTRWAEVALHLNDGRTLTSAPHSPRGDRDRPLSDAQIAQKFHLFSDPVLGRARAEEIYDLTGRFDSLDATGFARLLDLCLTAP
ncbi:MmgE/PrpD family protein [Sulfitobacter sp. HNIBRBA2951]|uniref:MmgE/PrpD family protein n=1 Tax=Sulfitobacter aquimarinus TaxID=3158557 RepID=UPI0032DFA11C